MNMTNLMMMATIAKMKIKNLLTDETGEVNIVATVVLIGVAVLLAIVFKDAIGNLLTNLLDTIQGNATGVVNDKIAGE